MQSRVDMNVGMGVWVQFFAGRRIRATTGLGVDMRVGVRMGLHISIYDYHVWPWGYMRGGI